ncbi:Intestinal mucin-like protein [Merluccius polli]|uniref:Intestinal mucin-like protein n=1 Tax=Merluccius polli TaxID=89951 RepID=A0AA47NBN4_MERPO|nr:Intestinal mucin-like protein [Merluccius polli]
MRVCSHQPGSTVPSSDLCKDCSCSSNMDAQTGLYTVICTPKHCNTTCNANETWSPPGDKCVEYTCDSSTSPPTTVESQTTCPEYNPDDCVPDSTRAPMFNTSTLNNSAPIQGTEVTDAKGCCKTCQRSVCEKKTEETTIEVGNCKNLQPVQISYCAGSCGSSSKYSFALNKTMHHCSCCKEATTSEKEVTLTCADGSTRVQRYTSVETCGCEKSVCVKYSRRRR